MLQSAVSVVMMTTAVAITTLCVVSTVLGAMPAANHSVIPAAMLARRCYGAITARVSSVLSVPLIFNHVASASEQLAINVAQCLLALDARNASVIVVGLGG